MNDEQRTFTPQLFRNFVTFYGVSSETHAPLFEKGKLYQKEALTRAWKATVPFVIQTPEGEFDEQPAGTFIAEDANGNFYPIAADVMEKTYRQVAGEGGRTRNLTTYSNEELISELESRGYLPYRQR